MDNPITVSLPQNLPTNWTYGQTVAPNGSDVGLSEQYGFNYLNEQVNAAQQAAQQVGDAIPSCVDRTLSNLSNVQTALSNICARPNKNLLDNWYFVGGGTGWGVFPVNQQGQTSYNAGDAFDRWKLEDSGNLATVQLQADGITITNPAENTVPCWFTQYRATNAAGETVIASMLVKSLSGTVNLYISGTSGVQITGQGVQFFTGTANDNIAFRVVVFPGSSIKIAALKLEYGTEQTLGYQDSAGAWQLFETPDYGKELAKCQAYLVPLNTNGWLRIRAAYMTTNLIVFRCSVPCNMRVKPALSGEVNNLLVFPFLSQEAQSDGVFTIDGYGPGYVDVMWTKTNHGLSDASLNIQAGNANTVFFAAPL